MHSYKIVVHNLLRKKKILQKKPRLMKDLIVIGGTGGLGSKVNKFTRK